jgi:hypothetical protein
MKEFVLLFFEGCPNARRAQTLLESLGVAFTAVEQSSLPAQDPRRGYTSPTILLKSTIVYGAKTAGDSAACSVATFDESEIRDRLVWLSKSR